MIGQEEYLSKMKYCSYRNRNQAYEMWWWIKVLLPFKTSSDYQAESSLFFQVDQEKKKKQNQFQLPSKAATCTKLHDHKSLFLHGTWEKVLLLLFSPQVFYHYSNYFLVSFIFILLLLNNYFYEGYKKLIKYKDLLFY